jgi:hypothetical protein
MLVFPMVMVCLCWVDVRDDEPLDNYR